MHLNPLKKHLLRKHSSEGLTSRKLRMKSTKKFNFYNFGIAVFLITNSSWMMAVYSQEVPKPVSELPAGTEIKNQATGSFEDPNVPGVENVVQSNEVIATIAEVAGIAVTPAGIIEAPKGTDGGGKFQGNGKVNQDDIVYYDYIITNVGNDITQFFIPGVASSISGGTIAGPIKITQVDIDGASGATEPKVVDIAIPPEGGNTGADGNGSNGLLGADGIIPVGGTIRVRIPVKITGAPDTDVKVVLGDTGANDNSAGTQNQPFVAGNQDVFTQDNTDDTPGETLGLPANGDGTTHRQEASAVQSIKVLLPPKDPNVLLVKRITKVNDRTTTVGGNVLDDYIDEANNPYDDNSITLVEPVKPIRPDTDKWPDLNGDGKIDLLGGIDGGNVKPGDEIEYTIYYLSSGEQPAKGVLFCDYVPNNVTYMPTAYSNGFTPANGGVGADRGVLWQYKGKVQSMTGTVDGDMAMYFPPGIEPSSYPGYEKIDCDGDPNKTTSNTNGAIVVNLGELPNVLDSSVKPEDAYGFIRFRGRVK
jgi:uncharacterized repeat protein (TIGR01451 family)